MDVLSNVKNAQKNKLIKYKYVKKSHNPQAFFDNALKYKYKGEMNLFTPGGFINSNYKEIHSGLEWKHILVYELSENSMPPLSELFEVVS